MDKKEYKCILISDFNIENLASYISNDKNIPKIKPIMASYGQVAQILIGNDTNWLGQHPDFAIVWTQPQSVIESFNIKLDYRNISLKQLMKEVDEFCSLIKNIKNKVGIVLIPTWVSPSYHRGYGMIDMKNEIGISNTIMRMNLRIADNFDKESNIFLLNTQKWIENSTKSSFNPKLWYMGKIPFNNEVFQNSIVEIKAAINGFYGKSKKLIILDLDDTLWGGIVGDDGWENLKLGGHDHIGEAFVDFQKVLKSYTNRGILLGIVSKNEESIALEAIKNHPEMVLKIEDFSGWKINWRDKAQNISDLVAELNLGIDSVVFIDDNPAERARVRETIPEVFVPEWPEDKMLYEKALLSLPCFDNPTISREDFERSKMYESDRKRKKLKNKIGSIDEWLKTLNIVVKIEELNDTNLPRTTQLFNKTNQMNLSTRRLSEKELMLWASQKNRKLWVYRVSDKYGDSGLTGILSIEIEEKNKKIKIVDMILSCRVFGRNIEEMMIYTLKEYAKTLNVEEIYAIYLPTKKNKPCLKFLESSTFEKLGDNLFSLNIDSNYQKPDAIQISY